MLYFFRFFFFKGGGVLFISCTDPFIIVFKDSSFCSFVTLQLPSGNGFVLADGTSVERHTIPNR